MFVSGDNDIGGEQSDIVTAEKLNRFKEGFHEQGYVDVNNATRIFNVNLLSHIAPNVTKDSTPGQFNRIIVSHISLLAFAGTFSDKVSIF